MTVDYAPSYAAHHATERSLLATLAYIAFLLLIFVGLDAFSPPAAVSRFGGVQEASGGDTFRQICFLATAALIALTAYQRLGTELLRALPVSMMVLLAWCLASALWSPDTTVVVRRAGLQILIVFSALLSVETVGAKRAFEIWRIILAVVLLVNFASIPLIGAARHGGDELDTQLIGNWRGLYGHKNIAGAVCAMTIILFLFTRTGWRNWIGIAIAAAAAVFLAMTHSKSSMGFLLIALLAGLFYHLSWRDGLSRAILIAGTVLLLFVVAALAVMDADALSRLLSNPDEFTGRAAIWAAELAYIRDHPFLGAGFGTFTDTKGLSPLHGYVSGSWVAAVSHGHSGYLQLLVTIGGVGFALTMLALVIRPFRYFWALDDDNSAFRPMLFALFVFMVLHNFMESDFLEGGGAWVALLLVIAALGNMARSVKPLRL